MELRKGFKKTTIGIIPEDWSISKFKDVSFMKGRIGWEGLKQTEFTTNTEEPFLITGMNFKDGEIRWNEVYHVPFDRYEIAKEIQLQIDDVLMTKDGTIGKLLYVSDIPYPKKATLNSHLLVFRPLRKAYSPKYLYYNLLSPYFLKHIELTKSGTTFFGVSQQSVGEYDLILPPVTEQTAIANALSDADALISSLEKLIEKKRNIKQGAMRELLRPKKGWVVKRVEDIAQVGRGRVISHKEIALSLQNTFPVYSSQTTNNGIMGYIDTFDFDGEYVTWTTDGENAGTVFYRNGKFNCTNVCGTIKVKVDNARFIAFLLNSVTSMYVSKNLANPKLMNDPMKKIEISLPTKEEQERIANIIMEMENEVILLEKKLSKSKMLKQGMMQELLTGKIRLI